MGNKHSKGCYYAFRHETVSSLTCDSDYTFLDVTDRYLIRLVFFFLFEVLSAQRHTETQQCKADGLFGLGYVFGHDLKAHIMTEMSGRGM